MMNRFLTSFFSLSLLLIFAEVILPQSNFNVQQYRQFLAANQNLTTPQLLQMHNAGAFASKVFAPWDSALFNNQITTDFSLTPPEIELICNHGFMVSERLTRQSFGHSFLEIYNKDLPVFVSTDAILHPLHFSYDRILKNAEIGFLIDQVKSVLYNLKNKIPDLITKYAATPGMNKSLMDLDVFLTVPLKLLGESVNPAYPANSATVNELIALVMAQQMSTYTLFSDSTCRVIDFSQFTPRSHYTDPQYPQLAKYFRAMMWLGRIELYLTAPRAMGYPCPMPNTSDLQRQTVTVLLLREAMDLANAFPAYDEIEEVLRFFVGESDNVNFQNIDYLKNAAQITLASDILDSLVYFRFRDSLLTNDFAYQKILSQILVSTDADSVVPASAFLLFGQRFVIDSYIFAHVVYDKIIHDGNRIKRMLPNSLDILFGLGNDAAAQLLQPELDQYFYSPNLAGLRYLVDSYDNSFWEGTIYNLWLNSLRKLNPPANRSDLPLFMQTAAFWQEKMNTQLFSWAQLRHDNLLYAKQSYSAGTICSYPHSYVEPFPEFFANLKLLGIKAVQKFQSLTLFQPWFVTQVIDYFNAFSATMDTLRMISEKELAGTNLTTTERDFLKKMIYNQTTGSGDPPYGGWYPKLFFLDPQGDDGLKKEELIVADVHTAPTDAAGNWVGWVKHAGTGMVNLGVWVARQNDQWVAFIGPVHSYHEFTTTDFLRLTDEEWVATYYANSTRPSFTNLYLADANGNIKPSGNNLLTSVEDALTQLPLNKNLIVSNNYPNPFNPSTLINFTIPESLTGSRVTLKIFGIRGEFIAELINKELPAGNYLTRWEGKDMNGVPVSTGTYLYQINAGGHTASGKMVLLK
ncbi:MAG: DUF3160 domain-containing protein [Ignavibacteriales bacterium]|nr:DUF3160 domain-containing protein [Ignavibacteriales bacterium]HOJ18995.1 DUF3160 domain-containing protein [Ignavibacteriaceae bacterium]